MSPYISRTHLWRDIRFAYLKWAADLLAGVKRPRHSLVTVLYTVEGDGIVVSQRCMWTDAADNHVNIPCPCPVGLHPLTKEGVESIRQEWKDRHERYRKLSRWLCNAAECTQKTFPEV